MVSLHTYYKMEESSRFNEVLQGWGSFDVTKVLARDDADRNLTPLEQLLVPVAEAAHEYVSDSSFRSSIPKPKREEIDPYLLDLVALGAEIVASRNDAPAQFDANKPAYIVRANESVSHLQEPLVHQWTTYLAKTRPDEFLRSLQERLESAEVLVANIRGMNELANQELEEAKGAKEDAQNEAKKAAEAAGLRAHTEMRKYFTQLVQPDEKPLAKPKPRKELQIPIPVWGSSYKKQSVSWKLVALFRAIVGTALLVIVLYGALDLYLGNSRVRQIRWLGAGAMALLLTALSYRQISTQNSGMVSMIRRCRYYFGGYAGAAKLWLAGTLVAVAVTFVSSIILFNGLRHVNITDLTFETIAVRSVILLAPAYLIRFCVRNYNAAKHLVVLNTHRAQIAGILDAYTAQVSGKDGELKKDILVVAAQLLFDPGESGYLTRRDGAGAMDAPANFPLKPGV